MKAGIKAETEIKMKADKKDKLKEGKPDRHKAKTFNRQAPDKKEAMKENAEDTMENTMEETPQTQQEVERKYIKKGSKACGFHCIKVKNLKVTIGGSVIIENVNLHIHCGNLTAIIGKNGAGKSTLVKALLNEVKHEGTIKFKDIRNRDFSNLRIGYVPQHLNIDKNTPASVYDLFAAYISKNPLFFFRSQKLYNKIESLLEAFGAKELIDKRVCDLSGGEMQRVLLSLAISEKPNLLILDEPEAGMDHNGMGLFYENINQLLKNYDMGVLMVSHDLSYVEKYADHVILLDKCILKEGKPKEVFESVEFRTVFGERFV